MNYQEVQDYLFSQLPMYQRQGVSAFKKNLDNIIALCEVLGNPQEQFRSIHIAGTNGKGSVSHIMAAGLQANGYSDQSKRLFHSLKIIDLTLIASNLLSLRLQWLWHSSILPIKK